MPVEPIFKISVLIPPIYKGFDASVESISFTFSLSFKVVGF